MHAAVTYSLYVGTWNEDSFETFSAHTILARDVLPVLTARYSLACPPSRDRGKAFSWRAPWLSQTGSFGGGHRKSYETAVVDAIVIMHSTTRGG